MLTLFDQETATEEMLEIKYEDGYEKGTQYGMQQGGINMLIDLVRSGIITIDEALVKCDMTKTSFKELMKKA